MVSPDTAEAPYARVKRFLKDGLERGEWPPGALMPSEAELVARFGVSRMTVNRALRELQGEGLVERSQGVGTFAAQRHRLASTLTIRDLHEELAARGQQHEAEVLLKAEEAAPPALAERLGLAPGAPVFHTVIVHRADGLPLQLEDRYVNPAAAPGYLDVDFATTTPTHYLLQVAPLWEAEYSVEASAASAEEARRLAIAEGDPCLVVVRRTRRLDGPITIARLVHPGARYHLEGGFRP
ncbi:histidine utilization repressor [Rubrivivax gelatinosus]|uniref:Histidine utilization repressor n=1 Tax=Rubrivivax gelatinosus (strain NBRC 100245 / IL144) TaxID=983917 RepID=I0HVW3_RUBGI|nr:histidine utilization repressor [Rubrivivax gelatinosus]BAL97150.1 transcriptional regulator, histidine utilization repressor, GntR family HutC [Rubrivivax gelatinosus IL144]